MSKTFPGILDPDFGSGLQIFQIFLNFSNQYNMYKLVCSQIFFELPKEFTTYVGTALWGGMRQNKKVNKVKKTELEICSLLKTEDIRITALAFYAARVEFE